MASAYRGMEENKQAKTLLEEAVRLHPRHPVVLTALAEVLYELEEYEASKEYLEKSQLIKVNTVNEKLREKLEARLGNSN
jgi:Tfp pilus assembly protein PilF